MSDLDDICGRILQQTIIDDLARSNNMFRSVVECHPQLRNFCVHDPFSVSHGSNLLPGTYVPGFTTLANLRPDVVHYPNFAGMSRVYEEAIRTQMLFHQTELQKTAVRKIVDEYVQAAGKVYSIDKKDAVDPGNAGDPSLAPEPAMRKIALPPGYWMERIASVLFFFSPKTVERVFGETIVDYRHEMIEAEVKGKSQRRLRLQYWSGFSMSVVLELYNSTLGQLVRMLIKG